MKSTTTLFKPNDQLGSDFKIIPAIILMILIVIFLGAQAYFFIGTMIAD